MADVRIPTAERPRIITNLVVEETPDGTIKVTFDPDQERLEGFDLRQESLSERNHSAIKAHTEEGRDWAFQDQNAFERWIKS